MVARQSNARRWVLHVHLYMGLTLGLYAAVVSITGSALVFRPEMERRFAYGDAVLAPPDTGAGRPFQAGWRNLRRSYPASAFPSISISQYPPPGPSAPYRVKVQTASEYTFVYIDRWTGAILGAQHSALDWLQNVHFTLLGGQTGLIVNAAGAMLLVFVCLTGALLWWPGRRDLKRGFSIAWRARWPSVNYDLHGVTGASAVVLLAAVAIGGVWLAVRDFSRYHPAEVSWQSQVTEWPVDLDLVVARADEAVPGGVVTGLILPTGPSVPFRVDKTIGDRVVNILVDQGGGRVVRVREASVVAAGARLDQWLSAIHYGRFAGYPSRVLWVVLGVIPVVLFGTGFFIWWNRSVRKRWRSRKQEARAA